MKTIKRISIGLAVIFMLSSIGGYIYFEIKFSPPENYLTLSKSTGTIPITWVANEFSPMAALLLPVRIEGIPAPFYMQFDLGSPNTVFYKRSLQSIFATFPRQIPQTDSLSESVTLSFSLGKMNVSSDKFILLNHGEAVDLKNSKAINIIGTIGSDMIEHKITMLNLKESTCCFGYSVPLQNKEYNFFDFEFKKRKVLIPAKINKKEYKLLFDTGTSAFELVTSKKIWTELARNGAKISVQESNSWGKTLRTYTTRSNKTVNFSTCRINLSEVTYIEGTSFVQNSLMKLSGMGGMAGTKMFKNRILIFDCQKQKIAIY